MKQHQYPANRFDMEFNQYLANLIFWQFGCTVYELRGRGKKRKLVDARKHYIYFLYRNTSLSLANIGVILNRDHTTILYYFQSFQGFIETEPLIAQRVNGIQFMCENWIKDNSLNLSAQNKKKLNKAAQ